MSITRKAINKIYEERKDFILIGLTGRTGSGCSKAAEILSEDDFDKLNLQTPKEYDFNSVEERKYAVIYNYARTQSWKPFIVIKVSDIIASFIFEKGYDEFSNYLNNNFFNNYVTFNDKGKLLDELSKKYKDKIDKLSGEFKNIIYDKIDDYNNDTLFKKVYLEGVKDLLKELRAYLANYIVKVNNKDSQLYTYLFQTIGNNIRSSGDPFNPQFKEDKFYTISERINKLIKAIRYVLKEDNKNNNQKEPTLICIDAIRNPYEATFFKDRYRAFYLVAVNTEDKWRRKRLSYMKADEINSLDKIEYPEKLSNKEKFYNQNIGACLEIADIHIYNDEVKGDNYFELTKQILKYVMLMMHPGLITPTHLERCMQIAYNAKLNSGCLSRQVGAVVTGNDYSIKSVGWNEVPKGQISCSLRDVKQYCKNKDKYSYSQYELTDTKFADTMAMLNKEIDYKNLNGRMHPYCFKDIHNGITGNNNQVYTRALHAEENAFLQISKYGGEGVKGGYLFTTASPCELCAKKAYQLGIKKIYYIDPYPGISQNHILNIGAEYKKPKMELFYGAIGEAYFSLYMPKIPFKDELEMMTGVKLKKVIKEAKERKTSEYTKHLEFVWSALENLDRINIDNDTKKEFLSDIKTIEAQIKSSKPKEAMINECLTSITSILKNDKGNIVAEELLTKLGWI